MTISTRGELIELLDQGKSFEYLPFYDHRLPADGSISETCCSQWFPASFKVDGIYYSTAEHFMMAEKARLFNDEETLQKVLKCDTPREAKALGRNVRNFDSKIWKPHCSQIVIQGNLAKFEQNIDLGHWLKSTAPKILVEASIDDRIWGIGLESSNADAHDPRKWNGENLLGFAITRVRTLLLEAKN